VQKSVLVPQIFSSIYPALTSSLLSSTQELQCKQKEGGVDVYRGEPRNPSVFSALIILKINIPSTAANKHPFSRLILLRLNLDSEGIQATMSITLLQDVQDRVPISLGDDDIVARIDSGLLQSSLAIALGFGCERVGGKGDPTLPVTQISP